MLVRIEIDLTCTKITEDDKLLFEDGRDEIYFLVGAAAGSAQQASHVPHGDPGYIGFRGDSPATHSHVVLWQGGVLASQPINLGLIVMEQDNDSLGDSGRKALEALVDTLSNQTGTVGAIASALAPIVKGIIKLFANKHDVVGSLAAKLEVDAGGNLVASFGATNSTDPTKATTKSLGEASGNAERFKMTGGGSDYTATVRAVVV